MTQTFPTEADGAQKPSAESWAEDQDRIQDDSALLGELEALLEEAECLAKLSANPQGLTERGRQIGKHTGETSARTRTTVV